MVTAPDQDSHSTRKTPYSGMSYCVNSKAYYSAADDADDGGEELIVEGWENGVDRQEGTSPLAKMGTATGQDTPRLALAHNHPGRWYTATTPCSVRDVQAEAPSPPYAHTHGQTYS